MKTGIMEYRRWNNGINTERKIIDKNLIHKILKLCNFFLIN